MRRTLWVHCTALALAALAGVSTAAPGPKQTPAHQTIVVVGDSLSAEYGLPRGKGWVALLDQQLKADKTDANVINASISGDTTAGGKSRLPALLKQHQPTIVIIELGGNDALRGLPLSMTRDNLKAMTQAAQAAKARVLIVGIQVPPNYGRQYANDFAAMFSSVAQAEGASVLPFLLKGVADVPGAEALFQADRIHPREQAHPTMLANVMTVLKPMLRQ